MGTEETFHVKACTAQSQYKGAFPKKLAEAHKFEDICAKLVMEYGFYVQQGDASPFKGADEVTFRLNDLNIKAKDRKDDFNLELKDWCEMIYYPATGLLTKTDDKYMQMLSPEKTLLAMRDNEKFVSEFCRCQPWNGFYCKRVPKTRENLLREMEEKGFISVSDGDIIYEPWGNFLSVLHLPCNVYEQKKPVPSVFGPGPQILFKMSAMVPLKKLISDIKEFGLAKAHQIQYNRFNE